MSVVTGRRGWVGIALETGGAGVPINPTIYLPFLECNLRERITPIGDNSARGIRDEQSENSILGKSWGEGALKVNLDPTLAPILLGMVMGDFGTPVSEGGGVYTHTFARKSDNAPKTASVIFDRVTDRQLFPYLVVNSAELAVSDGLAVLTANCLSRLPVASVSGTLTVPSGTLFCFKDAEVRLGADLTATESATPLKVRDFTISINNNSEAIYVFGSRNVDSMVNKNFQASGNLSIAFENTTQRDIFRNLTKKAMVVKFSNGVNEYVKLRIAKLRFDDYTPEIPIDDIASEGIDFVAEYSTVDTKTLDIQVRNSKSSY